MNGTYTIGLWDISGNLLTSTSVSETGDLLASGFRWADIPDLTLSAGNYVVGSAGDWAANGDLYYYGGTYTTAPELAFVQGRYLLGGTLQFPTDLDTDNTPSFLGGNASLIPVPGPLPILGFAAALGHSRRLRKRIKDIKSTVDSSVNQGM